MVYYVYYSVHSKCLGPDFSPDTVALFSQLWISWSLWWHLFFTWMLKSSIKDETPKDFGRFWKTFVFLYLYYMHVIQGYPKCKIIFKWLVWFHLKNMSKELFCSQDTSL